MQRLTISGCLVCTILLGGGLLTRSALAAPQSATKPSASEPAPHTLGEAARQIRLRWPEGHKTLITNKNLTVFSRQGGLTTVVPSQSGTNAGPVSSPGGARNPVPAGTTGSGKLSKKALWQKRYRSLLMRIALLKTRIKRLDAAIPRLWNTFYAWDDPAYRDGVIKPKLDTALAQRQKLKAALRREEAALPRFLDQARRHSIPPGWLREVDKELASRNSHQPSQR